MINLSISDLLMNPMSTSVELYNQYFTVLSKLLNKHAPLQEKKIPIQQIHVTIAGP